MSCRIRKKGNITGFSFEKSDFYVHAYNNTGSLISHYANKTIKLKHW